MDIERYVVSQEMRERIKGYTGKELKGKVKGRIVSVGDFVSLKLFEAGLRPDVVIYDEKTRRGPFKTLEKYLKGYRIVNVRNPAGEITRGAVREIFRAAEEGNTAIKVEGEEDLLAVVCCVVFPEGTTVVYGDPFAETTRYFLAGPELREKIYKELPGLKEFIEKVKRKA